MAVMPPEVVVKAGAPEVHVMEPGTEASPDIRDKAQHFMDSFHGFLKERTEAYVEMMAEQKGKAAGPGAELGGPITALGYSYWNVLSVGPIQFFGNPPWRPSKIIAAGELTLLLGVVWVNPGADPGGGIPGTVALGGRGYRVRFETVNLSTVTNGPDALFAGAFPAVPGILFFPWFFVPADPGPNPNLLQTHLTADITNVAQPFAAFGTWHFDVDVEPSFLGRPTRFPGWEFDAPCRYLVYRK